MFSETFPSCFSKRVCGRLFSPSVICNYQSLTLVCCGKHRAIQIPLSGMAIQMWCGRQFKLPVLLIALYGTCFCYDKCIWFVAECSSDMAWGAWNGDHHNVSSLEKRFQVNPSEPQWHLEMQKFKIWRVRILKTELTFTEAQNKTVKIQNCRTALTAFILYFTDDMSFLQLITSYFQTLRKKLSRENFHSSWTMLVTPPIGSPISAEHHKNRCNDSEYEQQHKSTHPYTKHVHIHCNWTKIVNRH